MIDALAGRALFAAQLLAGEMPQEIDQVFAAAGCSLFPRTRDDLQTSCSCPDSANPCKHVAAAQQIYAKQLADYERELAARDPHNFKRIEPPL